MKNEDKRIQNDNAAPTCWPHFPGVIVIVEDHDRQVLPYWNADHTVPAKSYEARIYGKVGHFKSYDAAVQFCIDERAAREYAQHRAAVAPALFPSIAEELAS